MHRKLFLKTILLVPFVPISAKGIGRNLSHITLEKCFTQEDMEGPFYKANAPKRSVIETEGEALRMEGKVVQGDNCKVPIPNAVIDVWHCDNHGDYDMEGFKGRGQVTTDANGQYSFTTILPPSYGSRPRHIHFKITAEGHKALTTQLYFEGDPNLKNDFARNANKDRVIALSSTGTIKKGVFTIYL